LFSHIDLDLDFGDTKGWKH